jgi:serine/threonine protein phosphatase PrpC
MKVKSASSFKGRREYMEDTASHISKDGISVALVCDGHGGDSMSKRCSKELPVYLLQAKSKDSIQKALEIRQIIVNFGNATKRTKSGTTVTGILDDGDFLYIFNVGDSRTSVHMKNVGEVFHLKSEFDGNNVCRSIVSKFNTGFFTTIDHDASLKDEQVRIAGTEGVLVGDRLNGILNVTRTLGDNGIGPGLCHVPDVFWIAKKDIMNPVVMYSDGIYEPIKGDQSDEKKHLIYHIAEKHGAEALVANAYNSGSSDNLTAIVMEL